MVKNFLRILVCPLDWGIGHATRCVPVIRQLIQENHQVIIAADGRPMDFLRSVFPELEFISLPGYKIAYPTGNRMVFKMAVQAPGILLNIVKEHNRLKKITSDYKIDVVISDNRFGLWSKEAYSVYMTHQVFIKAPDRMQWAEPWLFRFHRWFSRHYQECWIPDLPGGKNLSGDLSHKFILPLNMSYIGILSRFTKRTPEKTAPHATAGPDLLIMLSGPEPQRTLLENIVLRDLGQNSGLKTVVLRGLPGNSDELPKLPGVIIYNHISDEEMSRLVSQAGLIICRPGYSTVMDLAVLGKSAVLVPTPGQTEQEYLAGYLAGNGLFKWISQENFSIESALQTGAHLPQYIDPGDDGSLLTERVIELPDKFREWKQSGIPLKLD